MNKIDLILQNFKKGDILNDTGKQVLEDLYADGVADGLRKAAEKQASYNRRKKIKRLDRKEKFVKNIRDYISVFGGKK